MCMWRSEDNLESQFPPSMRWILRIELRLSGLATSPSTHWTISLLPPWIYFIHFFNYLGYCTWTSSICLFTYFWNKKLTIWGFKLYLCFCRLVFQKCNFWVRVSWFRLPNGFSWMHLPALDRGNRLLSMLFEKSFTMSWGGGGACVLWLSLRGFTFCLAVAFGHMFVSHLGFLCLLIFFPYLRISVI